MADISKGKWKVHPDLKRVVSIARGDGTFSTIAEAKFISYNNVKEAEANANIIVAAVNACQEVNQDNPMAVAESIKDMHEALEALRGGWNATKHEACMEALAKAERKQ